MRVIQTMVFFVFFSLSGCDDAGPLSPLEEEPGPEARFGCAEEMTEGTPRIVIPTVITNGPAACEVFVNTRITVLSTLTVEPGVVIKFGLNGQIRVEDGGVLEVNGTEAEPVLLQGAESVAGYWQGIRTFDAKLVMRHVQLSDAGQPSQINSIQESGIYTSFTTVDLQHVTVNNSAHYGIYLNDFTTISRFENVTLKGNNLYGLAVIANQVHLLDAESDYAGVDQPNLQEGVLVVDGVVNGQAGNPAWQSLNTHYITRTLRVQDTALTLEPGVEIRFDGSLAAFIVENSGWIKASGSNERPVILRGTLAQAGSWIGLSFFSDAQYLNELDHVMLLHAGSESEGAIRLYGATLSVSNTLISDSESWAIACPSGSQLTLGDNVVFSDNASGDVQSGC